MREIVACEESQAVCIAFRFTGAKCPVCKRGRLARLLPSKKYREYEEASMWCLQRNEPITTPVNVQCLFYMPTLRRVDLVNLLEAACDVLVTAGVLADDNSGIVVSHDGSRVLLDRDRPRTEIYITEANKNDSVTDGIRGHNSGRRPVGGV